MRAAVPLRVLLLHVMSGQAFTPHPVHISGASPSPALPQISLHRSSHSPMACPRICSSATSISKRAARRQRGKSRAPPVGASGTSGARRASGRQGGVEEEGFEQVELIGRNRIRVTYADRVEELDTTQLDQTNQCRLWLEARSMMKITASEFSAVMGNSPFSSRSELMETKLRLKPPFRGNVATDWGLKMEPLAVADYMASSGHAVTPVGLYMDDSGRFGASPDGLVVTSSLTSPQPPQPPEGEGAAQMDLPRGLLEVKTFFKWRSKKSLNWSGEHVPIKWRDQIQGQLEFADCEWCDLFLWIPKNSNSCHHHTIRVYRDRTYWREQLLPEVEKFVAELDAHHALAD